MGNSNSSSDTEEDPRGDVNEDDDAYSDNELDAGTKEEIVSADLNNLFDPQTLRTLAAKIREEVPSNVTQQHHNAIVRWLCDRPDTQETVTLAQFTDMLVSKGASKIEARRVFQEFDMDGSGVADITTILDAVQSYSSGSVQGEIGKSIRMLQACTLTPGFVDVYTGDKNPIHNHGERILKYLLRNRAESRSLPFPCLNGFNNTSSMRQSVLKSTFNHLKNSTGGDTEEQELAEGEELRPITKCYSGIEVSTNTSDAYRLTNGDPNTFWQSDGTARSHWIRLRMKNNVVLKLLSINVASSDQSYMPELVTISTGRNPRSLREIKEIRIPSNTVGEFVLLKNVKLHYPVIQINIKRCHSDGCDTRIHALKAVAYRVVKEPGVSVLDASATWYLQVLASLVGATLPQAPQLRTHIINHTRTALEHMPPLSLCPASSDRPQFLSRHVLRELDSFILEMSINEGNTQAEGLHLLLSLNLARGHVARLIQVLKYFYEQPDISLKCASVLASALEAKNKCWEKLGSVVPMTVLGCHGGKENMTALENCINHSSEGSKHVFYTDEDKRKTDLFFKCKDYVQFTKFRIKIPPGGKGPRRGMIFVYNHTGEFDYEEEVKKFSKYDNWHELTYKFSVNIRSAGVGGKSDNPVSYFHFDDDCDEMDVPVSWYPAGKTVLVKLFEPRQESASKLGLVSIKFFGFVRKLPNLENDKMSLPSLNPEKQPNCSSLEIVQIVITFLVDLSLDQVKKKGKISRGDFLDFQGVDLETIWTLYKLFKDSDDAGWKSCSLKILKLLHGLTPVMIPLSDSAKVVSDEVFHYLCNVIDSTDIDKTSQTYLLSEQLIVDGASLFFPNKEMKRKKLFTMMNNVDNLTTAPSVALVFQSLCQFFSSVDPQGLLDLPKVPTESFNVTSVLDVMKTLIVVASQEFTFTSVEESANEQLTYLIQLTGSLQSSLLAWCSKLLNEEDETMRKVAMDMTTQYACHVATRAVEVMETLISRTPAHLVKMSSTLQPPFLSSIVRQLILILNFLSPKLDSRSHVMLLQSWKPLLVQLETIAVKIPDVFPKISCDKWAESKTDDIVLRTWELESNHNYENNSHISQTFCCPGATSFVVDFDPRSETERRYDYLEFTDGKGISRKFDQKVGNPKWPKQVVFSGPNLHFLFRSDGSNTEWGYKFLVTAKGTPDAPLSWPYDLELGLAKLFGGFCGLVLSSNPVVPKNSLPGATDVEDSTDQEVLRSELWTSLFRGGYMVGKLQRSLSHKVTTEESIHLLEFFTELETNKSPLAQDFLKKCRQQRSNVGKLGGEDVDKAVVSVFLALLWHTQQLREDLERYLKNKGEMSVSEGLVQAYNTAESIRMSLVSQRQKVKAKEDEISQEEDPVSVCKKKAEFLLKFAGLTKVQLKADMRNKPSKLSLKKIGNKKNEMPLIRSEVYEKFPSFRLVMEFIQDLAWTTERVQQMLKERSQYASAVCEVYHFASEIIQILTEQHLFQITLVLFFQEMFSHQDNFPLHYADGLEGCGLEKEGNVRRAYYALIRKLTETFQNNQGHAVDSQVIPAYRYIQACLLHLLDTQWKPYDLTFVSEIKLPELFMKIAKETVKMRNCTMGEEEEVEELRGYKLCMSWLEECAKGFSDWYKEKEDASKDQKKEIQMFVARFCDLLDVEINCDGCGNTLPGRRYRCLQCVDMDLCTTCFSGGVKPEGDHKDDHDIVHLVFKCNKCQGFIIGTRIHCDICEDFDLCLGCHSNQKFPAEHLESHAVTRIPPVRLKTLLTSDSLTQAYIHQHVWLLFTSLSLILGEIIRNDTSHVSSDSDYIRLSAQLQNQCITLCTDCLEKVPDDADDGSKHLLQEGTENLETRQEEAFAFHSQERIMGLLGAMIPLENKIPIQGVTYNFTTKDFLHLLYKVARGDRNHELNTQHLGMGLLGRLLTKSSTEVSDEAVLSVVASKSSKPAAPSGQETVNYLFNFGASCLEKSGIEWACSMARILGSLSNADQWKSIVNNQVSKCVQMLKEGGFIKKDECLDENNSSSHEITSKAVDDGDTSKTPSKRSTSITRKQKPELSSIFAMFVMAGFPEVLTIGNQVNYIHKTLEKKNGIVIKNFPDKCQTLVVDVQTRRRHTVKDQCVTCTGDMVELWDTEHVTEFTSIVTETVSKIKAGETLEVETLWVLSLALKVLHNYLQTSQFQLDDELFKALFIQCLVQLASLGTGFSQQWLLKDLEVLSLMLYTHDRSTKTPPTIVKKSSTVNRKNTEKSKLSGTDQDSNDDDDDDDDLDDDDDDDDIYETISSSSSSSLKTVSNSSFHEDEDLRGVFGTVDSKTKTLFEALHEKFKVPTSVLQVIYDMHEGSRDAVIKAIVENFENSDEIKNFMESWEKKDEEKDSDDKNGDKMIDTGIILSPSIHQHHHHHHHDGGKKAVKYEFKREKLDKATEEKGETSINLIPTGTINQGKIGELRQTKSTELLRKELLKYGRCGSREFLSKVNMAMSIIYSRNLLRGLLARWPPQGPTITSDLLGCTDIEQIPCILDLLYKMDGFDNFLKVVEKVIINCDHQSLIPIACKACQFMEEIAISSVTKETEHNYPSINHRGKVHLSGASFLTITFDSRCSLMEDMDELVFYICDDPDKRKYEFTGQGKSRWTSFQVPGDTIHYKFNCDSSDKKTDFWGYRFTVTAGSRDSFETGYNILDFVLSQKVALSLPLQELWLRLVYVACIQTGTQRLQAIQLLLKIIECQPEERPAEDKRLDFSVLSPLWKLYIDITKPEEDPTAILPPVVRALTELFLQVENLVQTWDIVTEYLIVVMDSEDIRKACFKGLYNIAAIGYMINHKNTATDLVKAVTKKNASKSVSN